MTEQPKLYVEAVEGRIVPFHPSDMPEGTMGTMQLKPEDGPTEIPDTVGNRRKIRSGDLRIVERRQTLPGPATSAALAEDLLDTAPTK